MPAENQIVQRLRLSLLGGAGGLAGWLLTDVLAEQLDGTRLQMVLVVLAAVFFCDSLLLACSLRLRRAMALGAGVALGVAALTLWASYGFDDLAGFLSFRNTYTGLSGLALQLLLLALLPLPFLVARLQLGRWRDYPALFLGAWNLLVRFLAALVFSGLAWLALWLASSLVRLVGIDLIERLIDEPAFIWIFTGAVFGLAFAVTLDLSGLISPELPLRLLRLLLPPFLLVVAVFILALPLRGLDLLFGRHSTAAILMTVGWVGVTLTTVAAERDAAWEPKGAFARHALRAMALMLPVLAGLAFWAIWLRVADYGWTPERLAAAFSAVLLAGYGLLYPLAALRGHAGWIAGIRRANVAMALVSLAAAALWCTPPLDSGAISSRSQLGRYLAGRATVAELPLTEMRFDWGRAGARALDRLERLAAEPGRADGTLLAGRIAKVRRMTDRFDFEDPLAALSLREELRSLMPVRPEGAAFPDWILQRVTQSEVEDWIAACKRVDAQGRPGCVVLVADFDQALPGEEVMVLLDTASWNAVWGLARDASGEVTRLFPDFQAEGSERRALIDGLLSNDFRIGPSATQSVFLGGRELRLYRR